MLGRSARICHQGLRVAFGRPFRPKFERRQGGSILFCWELAWAGASVTDYISVQSLTLSNSSARACGGVGRVVISNDGIVLSVGSRRFLVIVAKSFRQF